MYNYGMEENQELIKPASDAQAKFAARKKRRVHFLAGALFGSILVAGVVIIARNFIFSLEYNSEVTCNTLGINLHGDVVTYRTLPALEEDVDVQDQTASENVIAAIAGAEADDAIQAIVLEVDSYGGYPVAGEEIAVALRNAKKPTVAMIRQTGASAAYLAATGAKIIFASKYSDVGGIGASMSYLDNVIKNQREGLTYNILSTGKFKDAGDPNKPLTTEERALIMRDLAIAHQDFIEDVATNRGLDVATVTKLADGSTMPGEMALENRLIDRIGGRPEVELYLAEQIGAKPEFCWE